jgi:hypothetical protein
MKAVLHKIEVTCALELSAREVELLECLTSYDNNNLVAAIFGEEAKGNSVSYNGGVTYHQMLEFLGKLHAAACQMKATINAQAKNGLVR